MRVGEWDVPTPELIAATQAGRYLPNAPVITDPATLADKLRDTALYPLFAKQVDGPVFLELNYGGDLNLHQLAHGAGVLDETYREHLQRCGYRGKL